MNLYAEGKDYKLYHGNMLAMGDIIAPNSIDSIVTDPPYELNFMGKGWDNSGIAFSADTWKRCYTALKPGGYLLAFGGTRTFHRIAVAIEDAGFEIRDTIMWLYGSGFPKSLDLGKAVEAKLTTGSANTQEFKNLNGERVERGNHGYASFQNKQGARDADYNDIDADRLADLVPTTKEAEKWSGWGTCLKPAYEPIIVARKPCEGSATDNVLKWGVGGINIDGCKIGTESRTQLSGRSVSKSTVYDAFSQENAHYEDVQGRFPSNVILTYDETDKQEVCGGMPISESGGGETTMPKMGGGDIGVCNYQTVGAERVKTAYIAPYDRGSAARYFYCAKASKRDRDEGLEALPTRTRKIVEGASTVDERLDFDADGVHSEYDKKFVSFVKNIHPTVKPTSLMQYLVRLVTPNGGTVLDPFNGSGSTGKAVMWETRDNHRDYKYIGIELTEQYLPIAKARIEFAVSGMLNTPMQSRAIDNSKKHGLF